MQKNKATLVLGASDNPSRYSYLAINRLRQHGHPVFAIGKKETKVADVNVTITKPMLENIDTITLYLNPERQKEYYDYIISLKPKRVIFNPGAENGDFAETLSAKGIQAIEACTLVLLSTNQF